MEDQFFLCGAVGYLVAVLIFLRLRAAPGSEFHPIAVDTLPVKTQSRSEPAALFAGFRFCFCDAAVRRIGLAFAAVLFVSVGFGTWAPTYFIREYDLSLSQAGVQTQ